ncbi:hypothetical protein [Streptomyces sp. NPDC050704]|uniref:hypothetical protein n=1 Tax=Streptomyces sp. NPDC050704 TaxID=3157219 RepID=UPI00342EDF7A
MTVALLPDFVAHAWAASLTAFVSASPLEAMRTLIEAGPADSWLSSLPESSNPLPQAYRLSDSSATAPTAQHVRGFLVINLLSQADLTSRWQRGPHPVGALWR